MSEELKHTPLYAFHIKNHGRMVPFAGWEMPVQYTSILEEHIAVRESAGLFDVSHMGEITVIGSDAKFFLDGLTTNKMDLLKPGKAIYSLLCYSDGGVVDDIIIYQRAEDNFLICVNASNIEKDFEWITGNAVGFKCNIENESDNWGQLAIQGPRAIKIVEEALELEANELNRFHFKTLKIKGAECIISRTGYTGEDGLEIYCPIEATSEIAETVYSFGKNKGLALAGLGCRDSLRLEAGYPLYGHEIDSTIDPITAGLGWAVKVKKEADFNGKKALAEKKKLGTEKQVRFFTLSDRRIARDGDVVINAEGEEAGKILSGSKSPILNKPIGSALINTSALERASSLSVLLRGKQYPINLKSPPLHKA